MTEPTPRSRSSAPTCHAPAVRLPKVSPFVQVPLAAVRLALDSPGRMAGVLWLYHRADAARWAPFPLTCRELAEAAGLSRYGATQLLADLEDAGLAVLERSCTRAPSVCALARPGRNADATQTEHAAGEAPIPTNPTPAVGRKADTARGVDTRARPDDQTSEPEEIDRSGGCGGAAPLPAPPAPGPVGPSERAAAERAAVTDVFAAWASEAKPDGTPWHPRAMLLDGDRDKVRRAVQSLARGHREAGADQPVDAARDDLIDIIAAYHRSPATSWWRGENASGRAYLGLGLLIDPKRLGERLAVALEWRSAGRPVAGEVATGRPVAPQVEAGLDAEARKAWAWLRAKVPEWGPYGVPAQLHADAGKAAALQAAVAAVGGWSALGGSAYAVNQLERPWRDAYIAARRSS